MRVHFRVHNDIVQGLKYFNVVKRKSKIVEKYDEFMGSFAPSPNIVIVDLPPEEMPGGFLYRG